MTTACRRTSPSCLWLALAATLLPTPLAARAQVAGSTAASVTLTERHAVAMGWSAKRSVLGKTVSTESGQKIGQVQDIIIAPGGKVSYLIIGAGGFVGIGLHDVAVPAALQKAAAATEANAQARLQVEIEQLQRDVQVAEGRLAEL